MNFTKYRPYFLLAGLTALTSILFWFIFYLNIPRILGFPTTSLETVFANYDGPNYMVIAKCGYDKQCIAQNYSLPMPLEYYPAHFPGYPLLIKYFSFYTSTPKAMLVATLLGSILLTLSTYQLFLNYLDSKKAFWLTVISIYFPARMLVLRLVGAPEVWFISTIILSLLFFKQKKFFLSALFVALTQSIKSPGIILLAVYAVFAIIDFVKNKKFNFQYLYFLLAPAVILAIFYVYYLQTGDFWAYFHSGDNFHLSFLPYQVFVSNRSWINTIWLEDVIYLFLIAYFGIYQLVKKLNFSSITLFVILYTLATVFVGHRDISRYLSPVYPFLIMAFSDTLLSKRFKLFFWLILPAIILYTINFVIGNTTPITNWAPYL